MCSSDLGGGKNNHSDTDGDTDDNKSASNNEFEGHSASNEPENENDIDEDDDIYQDKDEWAVYVHVGRIGFVKWGVKGEQGAGMDFSRKDLERESREPFKMVWISAEEQVAI